VQHVVFGVRLDGFAELIRMTFHFIEQAFFFGLDIEVGENADREEDRQHHTESELKTYFPAEHRSPAMNSGFSGPFFHRRRKISDQIDEQHPETQQQQVLETFRLKNIYIGKRIHFIS
jgi:hypothetical protein